MAKEKKTIKEFTKEETQSFITELKKFGREAEHLAVRGGEKIAKVSQIGKLKGEIMVVYQKRKQKIRELGEKIIQGKDKLDIRDPEILKLIEEIEELEQKRIACDEQIEKLKQKYQHLK